MSPRTKPGFITFESDIAYSKILSLHCDSRNAILMQPGFTWIAVVLVWQGHSEDMYGPCCPKAPLALCHCQLYLLSNMPRKLVIWSKLLANSLLEKWKKKLLVLKIITPCSSLQVWIFFLNTRIFFLSWQVGGVRFEWEEFSPEEKSGANSRSPLAFRKKKKKFLFFLKLGVSTVALDMNSSAWGAASLMPGDSHLAQQDTPQWTPQQPRDHTGPDHQHPEGQPCSIFGEDQGNERKTCISRSHTEGQRSFVNFHIYI